MVFEIGKYRIKAHNDLCWEIFEWREVVAKRGENKGMPMEKWVSIGQYPQTFGYALAIIYERMLRDNDEVVTGLADAINTCKRIEKKLLSIEVPNEA